MTYALVAAAFGGVSGAGGASAILGQALFALGAIILVIAAVLLARIPEGPARYAGAARRR